MTTTPRMAPWQEALAGSAPGPYLALCALAHEVYRSLLDRQGAGGVTDSARFILAEARRFVDALTPEPQCAEAMGGAADSLRLLALRWEDVRDGSLDGEALFAAAPGLWARLMSDWPMGVYGELVAEGIGTVGPVRGLVLELGAGVGHTTRLVRRRLAQSPARLLATDVAYPGSLRLDFDEPFSSSLPTAATVVYATNALHCAKDPEASLGFVRDAMVRGGHLVLGEGEPFPLPGEPWALTALFGLMRGWFDGVGFRPLTQWAELVEAAGLSIVASKSFEQDGRRLGGVIHAIKS